MKLTPFQQDLLSQMAAGWLLRERTTVEGGTYLVNPENHMDEKAVRPQTVTALYRRGLLSYRYRFPIASYRLTELGRQAASQNLPNDQRTRSTAATS